MPIHPRWPRPDDDEDPPRADEDDGEHGEYYPDDGLGDLLNCPECGAEVYADAERCPECEAWIRPTAGGPVSHWPTWMKWLGLVGIGTTVLGLIVAGRCGML
jgi:hypothetical protein